MIVFGFYSPMDSFKRLISFSVFLALICSPIGAEISDVSGGDRTIDGGSDYTELAQHKSRILVLESDINAKILELKGKDDIISNMEKILKEKSDSIESLQSEIASIQKKGNIDAEKLAVKANALATELEKMVGKLKKEIEIKNEEIKAFEVRASENEKKVIDLNSEFENLQSVINEQNAKLRKTERALQTAEAQMMMAKSEAISKANELMEVHTAWLPPWLAVHAADYQVSFGMVFALKFAGDCDFITSQQRHLEKHWKEHVKPTADALMEKAIEKKLQAEIWAEPHIETIKTNWIPVVKEQWLILVTAAEPHVQLIIAKTSEIFESSRKAVSPHVIKVQELADPYFQEVKKFSKPYIDQIATATRPRVDKIRNALKPYTHEAFLYYGRFLESASAYHHQVQGTVQEKLHKHELTRHLATKELVWFIASALLALPIFVAFRLISTIFGEKTKNSTRNSHSNHSRRKTKQGHIQTSDA